MNTKHQKIVSDIFIMPLRESFFLQKKINTVIFACNCSGPLVGEEGKYVLLLSLLARVPQPVAYRHECLLYFNRAQCYVFFVQF